MSGGQIPVSPFETGVHDEDGNPLFVVRGEHANGIHPGKLGVGQKGAHVAADNKEHIKLNYEVLAANSGLYWKSINVGDLPKDAVTTGYNVHETLLYSAKGMIDGNEMIGKYNFKDRKALFPHGGKQYRLNHPQEIQILCFKKEENDGDE